MSVKPIYLPGSGYRGKVHTNPTTPTINTMPLPMTTTFGGASQESAGSGSGSN